jgi:predicted RNA-binding protein
VSSRLSFRLSVRLSVRLNVYKKRPHKCGLFEKIESGHKKPKREQSRKAKAKEGTKRRTTKL